MTLRAPPTPERNADRIDGLETSLDSMRDFLLDEIGKLKKENRELNSNILWLKSNMTLEVNE